MAIGSKRASLALAAGCALISCSHPESDVLEPGAKVRLVGSAGRPVTRVWLDGSKSVEVPAGGLGVVEEDRPPRPGIVPGARFVRLRLEGGREGDRPVEVVREDLRPAR